MGCAASLPSAEEFLQEFKPPDSEYCDGLTSTTQNIDLVVQQKLFSWSGGDFKVKDTSGKDYCVVQGKVMSMRDRIVILDTSGNEIACCLEKVFSMSPAMFVYGFKPFFAGQNPTKETQNGKPLYAWAKVWNTVLAVRQKYNIQMAIGDDEYSDTNSPDYEATAPGLLAPRLQVAKGDAGCALIERPTIDWEFANSYRVTVAKGIDPILMLALTICKDKLEEKKNDG